MARGFSRGDADDEAGRRDNPVVGAEHRRAQPADPLIAVTLTMSHVTLRNGFPEGRLSGPADRDASPTSEAMTASSNGLFMNP